MVALARKTLIREWPRFFPAIMAIGFAGLLLFAQAALVMGIFGSAAVYIHDSAGDLWVGYPGTQSVNLGRSINNDLEILLRSSPAIAQVEPMLWLDSDWRAAHGQGGVSISVIGINDQSRGLLFQKLLLPAVRAALLQPAGVIVDRADLDQLGVRLGDMAWIDKHPVRVVATVSGLRSLGGVNVITSLSTARWLADNPSESHRSTYFVARLHHPEQVQEAMDMLKGHRSFGPYAIWSAQDFSRRSQLFWLFDTGAGVAVGFLAIIVFLVGAIISSQALMAVIIASSREYATLNALGAGMRALRWLVLEQALWIGGLGLTLGGSLSLILLPIASTHDVPVAMNLPIALSCAALVLLLSVISGLFAMRGLMRAEPALLLR